MRPLNEFFAQEELAFSAIGILDIGAMLLDNDRKEYQSLLDRGLARVIGFEPVERECQRLNQQFNDSSVEFLSYFVGDGSRQTFVENNASMTSSLFERNDTLVTLFNNLASYMVPQVRTDVETSRLDDVKEIDFPVDYIKIDIQGGELKAFEGAVRVLSDTTVI